MFTTTLLKRGVVYNAREWVFSSARDYEDEKGLIDFIFIIGPSETIRPVRGYEKYKNGFLNRINKFIGKIVENSFNANCI